MVQFVYVSYISAAPEKVWKALIDPEMTAKYWQHINRSDWKEGSKWEHRQSADEEVIDLAGKVLEFHPPRKLVISWAFPEDVDRIEKQSRVTIEIEPFNNTTRLTLTHDMLEPGSDMLDGITDGWPKVISSLKSLMEVGKPLPQLW